MIPKGAKVRIKDSEIDSFYVDFQNRVRDRIGIVRGHVGTKTRDPIPLVEFPAIGRRRHFDAGMVREKWLEVVDLPTNSEPA